MYLQLISNAMFTVLVQNDRQAGPDCVGEGAKDVKPGTWTGGAVV